MRVRLPALRERGRGRGAAGAALPGARRRRALGRDAPEPGPALLEHLRGYAWPGNVRELANALRLRRARGRARGTGWTSSTGPRRRCRGGAGRRPAAGLHAETRALEERRLREALERTRGNKSQAARALGLSRQGLLKKLRRYGLTPAESAALALDAAGGAP